MSAVRYRFLTQNTAMIASNRRGGRPGEWSPFIEPNFDIACLQEVWTDRVTRRLLRGFSTKPSLHQRNSGTMFRSAGLVTLSWPTPIVRRRWKRFTRQANLDRIAGKGVILTELDIGLGVPLQIYNTHFNAARKFPSSDSAVRAARRDATTTRDPVYVAERLVTARQLLELARFIVSTRRPDSPAILCGDLNLNGESPVAFPVAQILGTERAIRDGARRGLRSRFWESVQSPWGERLRLALTATVPADYRSPADFGAAAEAKTQYQLIVDVMRVLGFRDGWGESNRNRCYTTKLGKRGKDTVNDTRIRLGVMASPDESSGFVFANDSRLAAPHAYRLDYLFTSNGRGPSASRIGFGKVRRTYVAVRGQNFSLPPHRLTWLSDHCGLATTISVST